MRAAVFEGSGRPLVVTTVPDPVPAAGELLLRVRRAGVCGTDLHLSADPPQIPPGTIMGHEFVGEVVATGAGVTGWRIGERACALPSIGCATCDACHTDDPLGCTRVRTLGHGDVPGAFAEYVRVGALESLHVPDTLADDAAAVVEPTAVAVHAVRAATLRAGEPVVILGAGPIGLAAATCARQLGAGAIAVLDHRPARRALAAAFGATAALDPSDDAAYDACLHPDGPPPVVIECIGMPGALGDALQRVRRRGRVVVVGACMQPDMLLPAMACVKEASFHFVLAYTRGDFAAAMSWLADGRIAGPEMVTTQVGFDAFPAVVEALRAPNEHGKVLLRP